MKLTWFGNTAFRIHIGGQIVVMDAGMAPKGVDGSEVVSGADLVVTSGEDQPVTDLADWKPRLRERLLDAGDAPRPVQIHWGGPKSLVVDADEDMPLLVVVGNVPRLGRWAEKAVVVLAGPDLAGQGGRLLKRATPRLIALAGNDAELDAAFAQLQPMLEGAGLIALEPGLAVEV